MRTDYTTLIESCVNEVQPPADGVSADAAYLGRCVVTAAVVLSHTLDHTLADNEGRTVVASLDFLADRVAALAEHYTEQAPPPPEGVL